MRYTYQINKYPWLVRIWNRNGDKYPQHNSGGYGFCGGTLVASKKVITAAWCVDKRDRYGYFIERYKSYEIAIRIGDHDIRSDSDDQQGLAAKFVNVKTIIQHQNWDGRGLGSPTRGFDIAILELEEELDLKVYTPACLESPIPNFPRPDPTDVRIPEWMANLNGETVWAYGWGKASEFAYHTQHPSEPYEVQLTAYNKDVCQQKYGEKRIGFGIMCAAPFNFDLRRGVCPVSISIGWNQQFFTVNFLIVG